MKKNQVEIYAVKDILGWQLVIGRSIFLEIMDDIETAEGIILKHGDYEIIVSSEELIKVINNIKNRRNK